MHERHIRQQHAALVIIDLVNRASLVPSCRDRRPCHDRRRDRGQPLVLLNFALTTRLIPVPSLWGRDCPACSSARLSQPRQIPLLPSALRASRLVNTCLVGRLSHSNTAMLLAQEPTMSSGPIAVYVSHNDKFIGRTGLFCACTDY